MKPTKIAVAVGMALFTMHSNAQSGNQQITVTGSAIPRIVSDEALPVQIVTKDEIRTLGVVTTEELLQKLPALQSLGGSHSSLDGAGGISSYAQASPSLRGLGSDYTVVLLNGRPSVGNLNLIPLAAIERVEVLLDGASSLYGADAIGGVINFITSSGFKGAEASLNIGSPTRNGGGQRKTASLTIGAGDINADRFNVTASFTVDRETELYAGDRNFAKTGNVEPYLFGAATGQGNIEGAYVPGVRTVTSAGLDNRVQPFGLSPGSGIGNPLAFANKCGDIGMVLSPFPSSRKDPNGVGLPYCAYDSAKDVRLVPDRESTSGTLSARFSLNAKTTAFVDWLGTNFSMVSRYQPSPSRYSFLRTSAEFAKKGTDPALLISPNNPNYKTAADYLNAVGYGSLVGQSLAITSRVFDFGPRTNTNDLTASQFVGGFRGELGNHSWEIAALNISSRIESGVTDGYFYQEPFARIVNSRNDWNPWASAESQTPAFKQAVQAAKFSGKTITFDTFLRGFDGKLYGPLTKLPAGDLEYAAGFQSFKTGIDRKPEAALASGDIAGLGGAVLPFSRDRSVNAVFGEVRAPVSKDLELNASGRRDDYSDFGIANTYKLNARWKLAPIMVARASVGTGFKAPGLTSLWAPQSTGTSAQFTDPKFPTNRNVQVNEISGGNPDLKPEESNQRSIGFVLTPTRDLTFSVDAWAVKIDGKITSASTQEIVTRFRSGDAAYAGLVVLNKVTGEVETVKNVAANIGSADYRGVDVNLGYRYRLPSSGVLGVSLFGTRMLKADETSPSGAVSKKVGTMVDGNGDPVIGADVSGGVVVKWKHLLTTSYAVQNWRMALTQNYYTGYETGPNQWDGERHFIGAQAIYDAQVSYTGLKQLRLNLGVKNIFDKNPPMYIPVANQFAAGYDISMYDPRARFVYISANYRFN